MCTTACAPAWTGPEALAPRPDRRRIAGYTGMVRWLKILLPVAALLMVGAIFLVGRGLDEGESLLSPEELATLGAGLKLDSPRFSGRTAAGEAYVVRAEWALPDSAMPETVELHRPEGEIDLDGDIYALNVALHLPPWAPPAAEVWLKRDDPPPEDSTAAASEWARVRTLLIDLHAEHLRRAGG